MKTLKFLTLVIFAFILLGSARLIASSSSFTTDNVFNGRMWQLLNSSQKASHLTGIQEGIKLCLNQIKEDLQIPAELMRAMKESGLFDRRRILFSIQGITAIEAGLNNFYQDPAHLEIPIMDAYQHVTLELNYASAKDLANNLSNLRRKHRGDMK